MYSVPLYFQVTQRVSSTIAGAHLFPAVFGNAMGSLIAGRIIRRYENAYCYLGIHSNIVINIALDVIKLFV
jgi:hypothetical protein